MNATDDTDTAELIAELMNLASAAPDKWWKRLALNSEFRMHAAMLALLISIDARLRRLESDGPWAT